MTSEPDIAIVGAGAAGIGAARRLSGRGLSIVMLESMQRIGGRAWTKQTTAGSLDLGCGWLHSADRNPWTAIAEETGFTVVRGRTAWHKQFKGLGFSPSEQEAARRCFAEWTDRINTMPPDSDKASDALDADGRWTAYLQAMSGFISGDELERISARDYSAYDTFSTGNNWRIASGYGTLISHSLPSSDVRLYLSTPLESLGLHGRRLKLRTHSGTVCPRVVILTASTSVLAGDTIKWPLELDPWREAAARLPLGNNEKLFLEITDEAFFAPESNVLGDPHDPSTGTYYIRPLGQPVIECFLGGAGARAASASGADAAFARAIDQLASLFGSSVRKAVRPLAASDWTRTRSIGGAYSHALPGHANARPMLARPYDGRVFFAGEATDPTDFSTAHGAHNSGVRAADEALSVLMPQMQLAR